jgi:predicted transcriptional regulator
MHYLRNELGMTLKAVGQIVGRDHATVKWGLSRYDELKFIKNRRFLEMLGKIDGKA